MAPAVRDTATGMAMATPAESANPPPSSVAPAAVSVSHPTPVRPKAIFISAEKIARIAPNRLRGVRAATAVDVDGEGVGARLTGVGALGVELADGDVVTSIGGRATPTAEDATAAATAAWSSGARALLSATIRRGGQVIAVTVQVPLSAADAGR